VKKLLGAILALLSSVAFATTTVPVQLINPTGSSTGQAIVSTGSSSAPAWGTVPLSGLSAIAANTVLANATSASAAPTAFSMPSCSTSSSALDWTTSTGFTCNTSINAATLSGNSVGTSGAAVPLLNGANTWSGAQAFSSTITPSTTNGIVGTTLADNANSGSDGQFISASVGAGSPVSLTTATAANITSISLPAGDWQVWAAAGFVVSSAASSVQGGISTTSATMPAITSGLGLATVAATSATLAGQTVSIMPSRVNVSTTTTVYLVGEAVFTAGTVGGYGFIGARRWR
jgi:hypothetical protein